MNKDHDYEEKKVELENLLNNGMIDLEMYRKETEILERKIRNRDKRLKAEVNRVKTQRIEKRLAVIILIVCFSIFIFGTFGKRRFRKKRI